MTIALLSYHACPLATQEGKVTGGMNVYVLELAKALATTGHEIDIFTRQQAPDNQRQIQIEPGLRLFHLPAGPVADAPKKQLLEYVPEFADQLASVAEAEKRTYDLLDAHYYLSGLIGQELRQRHTAFNNVPMTMTFHTLSLMKNLVARSVAEQALPARIQAEQTLVKAAAAIISPSQADRNYLHYLYGADETKVQIISPGFNPELFFPEPKDQAKAEIGATSSKRLVVFVGRIEPLKGLDALLYALKILKQRYPDKPVCLWIVGGSAEDKAENWSHEQQRLNQVRTQLGLENSVRFVPQQAQDSLVHYYNAADVVVMPSHYESFGMAALEAMACNTPVITTNVAGISYLLDDQHQALSTTVNNPLHLADQLARLVIESPAQVESAETVSSAVADRAWPQVAGQVQQVWQSVLDQASGEKS